MGSEFTIFEEYFDGIDEKEATLVKNTIGFKKDITLRKHELGTL